jgi:RNA polymerase sigma factor (sigma-70 family)
MGLAAVPSAGRAVRVERSAAPESDATRDLYERFSGQIFGYCLHQLGSREEAEDAVQTTFMNAFRGLRRGIVPRVESAWLFKIAHNVCLSRRRSTWRRGNVETPNNFEVLQEVVPAREQMGDELIRLQDVLEDMPETQRRAILLREWQGLSYREIADELDVSQSAVETLIFRARRSLAAGLEVEQTQWRKRARHGFDAGTFVAALKGLLSTGTAAKVAATIAVATTAAVAVSDSHHHAVPARDSGVTHVSHVARTSDSPSVSTVMTSQRSLARNLSAVRMHHAVASSWHAAAPSGTVSAARPSQSAPPAVAIAAPSGKGASADLRVPSVQHPARPAPHGLANGHAKQAQRQASTPPAALPVAPSTPDAQDQPNVADQGNDASHGNGHGHG